MKYVDKVVGAIVDRIRARGAARSPRPMCSGTPASSRPARGRAVAVKYVRTVEITLADLDDDEDD